MAFDSTFRSAIPGQGLTGKMGDLPHQKPPKFTDPDQALAYIWKMISRKDSLKQIWLCMEQGVTIWHIRRALLVKLCLEGIIMLNLAIIIKPQVDHMLEVIGKSKGIDVKLNPKFRDPIKDKMDNTELAKKTGRHDGKPLPQSALKSSILPKPEDITKQAQDNGVPSDQPVKEDKSASLLSQIQASKGI